MYLGQNLSAMQIIAYLINNLVPWINGTFGDRNDRSHSFMNATIPSTVENHNSLMALYLFALPCNFYTCYNWKDNDCSIFLHII
jgi:hypothetical protein